jgi:hypothetical protein
MWFDYPVRHEDIQELPCVFTHYISVSKRLVENAVYCKPNSPGKTADIVWVVWSAFQCWNFVDLVAMITMYSSRFN